jgi:hypothetical protein
MEYVGSKRGNPILMQMRRYLRRLLEAQPEARGDPVRPAAHALRAALQPALCMLCWRPCGARCPTAMLYALLGMTLVLAAGTAQPPPVVHKV